MSNKVIDINKNNYYYGSFKITLNKLMLLSVVFQVYIIIINFISFYHIL